MRVSISKRKKFTMNGRYVRFFAVISNNNKCVCSFCGCVDQVYKLMYPLTEVKPNTADISRTSYRDVWLCSHCRESMMQALFNAEVEHDNDAK